MISNRSLAQGCAVLLFLILLSVRPPFLASQQPPSAGETDAYVLAVVREVQDRYPEDADSYFNAGQAHGRARGVHAPPQTIPRGRRRATMTPSRPGATPRKGGARIARAAANHAERAAARETMTPSRVAAPPPESVSTATPGA
ncbi:MAG TPA: hypothetical protein PK360_17235, partial [bacterium]|nr:hypothetical protein [bacterium]